MLLRFIQTNWATEIFDYKNKVECEFATPSFPSLTARLTPPFDPSDALDDIPNAVRTYPASGATAMLPLTPANNWTATIML
jgi:hypothetical protein